MATASRINIPITECSICFEHFQTPKVLPCGHTFCLECIEKYIADRTDSFPCPICGQDVQIPDGGAKMYTTNFIIYTLTSSPVTDRLEKVQPCPHHSERDVEYYCNDCKIGLCFKCIFSHHKDHETLDIECESTRKKAVKNISKSSTIIKRKIEILGRSYTTLEGISQNFKTLHKEACKKVAERTGSDRNNMRIFRNITKLFEENERKLDTTRGKLSIQIKDITSDLNDNLHRPETPSLLLLESSSKLNLLVSLCEDITINLPELNIVEWRESTDSSHNPGSIVSIPYFIKLPQLNQFRFDMSKVKAGDRVYYSTDKFTDYNYNITWRCGVRKYHNGYLDIYIDVPSDDNPNLNYCIMDYKISLLHTVDDSKTLTKTVQNTKCKNAGIRGWGDAITWALLSDNNYGYVTSNGQFIIQFDIQQVRKIVLRKGFSH